MKKLHVLIIPGDSYRFELTQARGLREYNIETGFLSFEILQSYKFIIKKYLRTPWFILIKLWYRFLHSDGVIEVGKTGEINDVKIKSQLQKPYNLISGQVRIINKALSGYEKYIESFGQPDLIHAHSRFLISPLIANKISSKYNIPYIVTEHSSFYFRDLVAKPDLYAVKSVLNEAAAWIAVSSQLGIFIRKSIKGIVRDFIEIPNAFDREFELMKINDNRGSEIISFLSIADLNHNKRHDLLINAFELSFAGKNKFQLLIGGKGPQETALERMIKEKDLKNQVHLLGDLSRAEVIKQISNCNFFVVSSDFETFSVVLVEALALGKPVISTKCGGPESIINGNNGVLVAKDNVGALADGMRVICENIEKYDPLKIRKECFEEYSTCVVTARLAKLYRQVLQI